MSLDISGGPLTFEARIDTDKLKVDAARAEKVIGGIGDKGLTNFTNNVKKQSQTIEQFIAKAGNSIETLRGKLLFNKLQIVQETDITKIARYNREIELLEKEIGRINNAGRTGFDTFGNVIPGNLKKTGDEAVKVATKTNVLSKGFGFLRTAANLIPGIGLAGIFGLIGGAVAALVAELFKGKGALKDFTQRWNDLKEVVSNANKDAGKQISTLKVLYEAATNVNLSMEQRKAAVRGLKDEFPDYFAKVKDEIILTGSAKTAYDQLTAAIIASSRASAAKAKLDEIAAQRLDVAEQRRRINTATFNEEQRVRSNKVVQVVGEDGKIVGGVGGVSSNEQRIAGIKYRQLKALRDQDLEDEKLNAREKFLINLVGAQNITKVVVDETTKRSRASKTGDNKEENDLLRERVSLLEQIAKFQADARQSGLVKEASELDKINEKYDLLIKRVNEYNIRAAKLGAIRISTQDINESRRTELNNAALKQDAANYAKNLTEKKALFAQYEEAKKQIGVDKSDQMFKEQTQGFKSYLEFLNNEAKKIAPKLVFGVANIGDIQKAKALNEAIKDATKAQADEQFKQLQDLLKTTESFGDKKIEIEDKYQQRFATLSRLRSTITEEEYERRLVALQESQDEEFSQLQNHINRQSALYKKLTQDVTFLSRDQIKGVIQSLTDELNKGGVSPVIKKQIEDTVRNLKDLLRETDATTIKALKTGDAFESTAGGLNNLSSALQGVNEELAETLSILSNITGNIGSAIKSFEAFKKASEKDANGKTDIAGQIGAGLGIVGSVISVVSTITGIFNKAADKRRAEREAERNFQNQILIGETEINSIYRERELSQVRLNKARIQGIQDEIKLLQTQKGEAEKDAATILLELQKQSFKGTGDQILEYLRTGGSSLAAITTGMLPLLGKSFDQLEELFIKGQLEGRAKELFETLRKLKQEGVDIDKQLLDLKRESQELFTGTTADSITDSIVEGFKNGLRTAKDFAGNFEDLMRNAALNSLKFKYLEPAIKAFFEDFAIAAESDGALTEAEISQLQNAFNTVIGDAQKQFEALQKITKLNLSGSNSGNSLTGAIRGITETQADLLAAQFGGQRIATLNLVDLTKNSLTRLDSISNNTALTVTVLKAIDARFASYESGARKIAVAT